MCNTYTCIKVGYIKGFFFAIDLAGLQHPREGQVKINARSYIDLVKVIARISTSKCVHPSPGYPILHTLARKYIGLISSPFSVAMHISHEQTYIYIYVGLVYTCVNIFVNPSHISFRDLTRNTFIQLHEGSPASER